MSIKSNKKIALNEESIVIKTKRSFLSLRKFDNISLVEKCIDEIKDKLANKPEILVYGRMVHQQRDVSFFSNESEGYKYSKTLTPSLPLTAHLTELLSEINKIYDSDFNGILINRYNNGNEYLSAHSDKEDALGNIGVVGLSFGASRLFRVRAKNGKHKIKDIIAESLQLLHMGGDFQKEFTHEIPKEKNVINARYSLTFRKHIK